MAQRTQSGLRGNLPVFLPGRRCGRIPGSRTPKVLAKAPLFSGLERVIRYVLLTMAAELGGDVEVAAQAEGTVEPT